MEIKPPILEARQSAGEFTEAAGRGAAGWTARFAVDTEVDRSLVGAPLVGTEHTKVLRVVGQITVAPNGQISDIAVDSAEALPGDPMRARWARRAARYPLDTTQLSAVAEVLKAQQEEWAKSIREVTQIPGLVEVLKAEQEKRAKMIRDAMPGLKDLADTLKDQHAQWAKMIRDAMPPRPGLDDILGNQRASTSGSDTDNDTDTDNDMDTDDGRPPA